MTDSQFHVECRVGRLVEVRPEKLQSIAAVKAIGAAIGRVMRELGTEALFCVDWRRLRVLAPEVATALAELLKGGNSRTLRSAALIDGRATFGLQMERVIREANNPSRRAFRDPVEMVEWLGELATPAESARARDFLNSGAEGAEGAGELRPLSGLGARARPGS